MICCKPPSLPPSISVSLLVVLVADLLSYFAIDRVLSFFLGTAKLRTPAEAQLYIYSLTWVELELISCLYIIIQYLILLVPA